MRFRRLFAVKSGNIAARHGERAMAQHGLNLKLSSAVIQAHSGRRMPEGMRGAAYILEARTPGQVPRPWARSRPVRGAGGA